MEFLILGPLEVRADGRPLTLSGAKQRALLAILLLHANAVVSIDRLIDDLWGDDPPGTGSAALQMRISALRKALQQRGQRQSPSGLLVTRAPGYLLRISEDELDATRFERLYATGREATRAGDPGTALTVLREALALWRGDPLADFAFEPFAQAEIARLSELRASAIEERIEADIQLGHHADVIADLEAHVAGHPFRERPRGQVMLALYRSGRQAEALAAFHEARRTLVDELGLEPGMALQLLERQILQQDSSLEAPPVARSVAPIDIVRPVRETRKTVTVVMTDALEQAGTAGIDPERLRDIGERYAAVATRAYERHGGVVERSLGTGLIAVFGIPAVHEDDALRAVRAAASLGDALSGLSDELERDFGIQIALRIGIATGEVVTGAPTPGRPPIVGEPLIQASQLQQRARPGQILLADSTRRMTAGAVRVEPVGPADSAPTWRLIDVGSTEPAGTLASDRVMFGRADELAQLRAAFERSTRDRTIHLCTVLGDAGVGKSRLAQEFLSMIADKATVAIGRCLAYGEGITFWPLREIVTQLAPAGETADLLTGDADAELVAGRVAGAMGITETTASVEETFWAVRKLFEAVARKRPLVVVVEDIHWAEPTLLAMVEYLAVRAREAPILLLALARPELIEGRPGFGAGKINATSILLEPLTEDESQALIDDRLGSVILDSATRARIQGTAEGNPLFLEQLVAMVAHQGAPTGELPVPPTIQALLAARIERLGPGERAVLERAAVVGTTFLRTAVAQLLPEQARASVGPHLEALVGKDLVRSDHSGSAGDDAYRFRHVLIQQSTYRSIPKQLRAETHEAFANWLEARRVSPHGEAEELVGYHLEQAFRYRTELGSITDKERDLARRAGECLASAGRRAFKAGDMPASVNLLGRAAGLMASHDPARPALLSDLGFALFEFGELDQASATLGEAIELASAIGDAAVEWSSRAKWIHIEMYRHPEGIHGERLFRQATEAIEVLRTLGDDVGLTRAWLLMADVQWATGKSVRAAGAARRSVHHARLVGSRREESWAFGSYGYDLLFGATPAMVASRHLEQHLRASEGAPVIASNLAGFLAAVIAMAGRFEEARGRLAASRARVRDLGLAWQMGTHDILGAFIESLAGDLVSAERDLRSALETFRRMHDRWFLSIVAAYLAKVILDQGRTDEAADVLRALDDGVGDPDLWIRGPTARARVLAARGQLDEAEALARRAVAQAEATDFLGFHADALVTLAEVLRLSDRPEGALVALASAIQLYERKGNVVEAGRVRAHRLQLSG